MTYSFIEKFKDKFYFIGCDIETKLINNIEKKCITFPEYNRSMDAKVSNWIKDYNTNAKHTKHYAVRTGKVSGITVLDFDTEYAYKMFCANIPNFESYFTVKTKKGWHVYCLYDPNLKSGNNVLKGLIEIIDIRNDPVVFKFSNFWSEKEILNGGHAICPPTKYLDINGNYFTYEYLGGTINPVPQYLYDCLKIKKIKRNNK
jgi:hypothetical protein